MRRIGILFILVTVFFSVTSCGFDPIEFKNIENLEIQSSKETGQSITATLSLYNPNNYSFTIRDVDIDVYLKNAYLGKLEISDTVEVGKKSMFVSPCTINVKKENLFVAGAALLGSIGKKELDLNMKGKMGIHYFIFNKDVKINHSEKVKL